ncbi:MAG TPA: single-stranded-DNA-specific exonuclease RecJ [Anaerolineae bacterium]|nr:single-stranded-DNA-specific exonuclease RecJ [Anaerolineae bacterium]HQK14815.1 single-stranded-DNA-specific exonuclease RecJ [Anaerolineae bacterium]
MKRWLDPKPVDVPPALAEFVGGHPLVAETLVRRGITTVEAARAFLDPQAYTPAPPTALPNLARAADRIEQAICTGEPICVWGDFDVDGQTATTLLVATLRELGARVTYHIPVRATESHGVKIAALQPILDQGARLILTCDTGIDAHEAIAYAAARNVDVIVTDHHELPDTLPPAYAVVNPHLLPTSHPLATLPGVGVAYKLAEALYARAGRADEAAKHLDLVALGIVADVAVVSGDTRYLLQRGLAALRTTRRLGLQELMKLARINPARLSEEHIGFALGPRLNALGRLDDANVIVDFLTTTDLTQARILASELEALNDRRKLLGDQVLAAAQDQIAQNPVLLESAALVLAAPEWPVGVIGIVANRLAELYHRPTVLITIGEDNIGHGSARSIEGCHITEALATQHDLLRSYGGHAMAAGLSLHADDIPAFRRGLSRAVMAQIGAAPLQPALSIDGYLPLSDFSLDLVADLERLAPFGPGNPPLTLATRAIHIKATRPLGRDERHLLLTVEDNDGVEQQVIWWRWDGAPLPEGVFDLANTVRVNDFRGQNELQIVWEDARLVTPGIAAIAPEVPKLDIVDYRREPHPLTLLKPLLALENLQIWREGPLSGDIPGGNRNELTAAATLVIWTSPPGPDVWRAVMAKVSPTTVYLFAVDAGLARLEPFLKHIAGLVKYALKHNEGRVDLSAMAAATANRESAIRLALAWLEARGDITIASEEGNTMTLRIGGERTDLRADRVAVQLAALLDEVAAYRRYFARADMEALRTLMLENGNNE